MQRGPGAQVEGACNACEDFASGWRWSVRRSFEREKEGKELLEIVEQFVGRKGTSLP